ncbi:MAG: aquaporin family protein [Clostridiales bacterium]|nr:aquaporin family protein [Clostridiales bacterium]
MQTGREFTGELLGTFLLVLFGCGSVANSVLFDAHQGLFQIAITWGVGVSLAIYATRDLSCAHLNPAVTLAMAACGRMAPRKVGTYLAGQFAGAILGGVAIYLFFGPSIASFEAAQGIVRGSEQSVRSARMFGEYYAQGVSMPLAMAAEGFGTFLLVLTIFFLTEGCNLGRPDEKLAPLFIGLTVASVICLFAPLTQAGYNPARDFGPRLVAAAMGWGAAAFPDQQGGFFFVYMLAPVLGALLAGLAFTRLLEPMMKRGDGCGCGQPKGQGDGI